MRGTDQLETTTLYFRLYFDDEKFSECTCKRFDKIRLNS